jgi:hypothetical protein
MLIFQASNFKQQLKYNITFPLDKQNSSEITHALAPVAAAIIKHNEL